MKQDIPELKLQKDWLEINVQVTWIDISPKNRYKRPVIIWKDAQNHYLLGKCKRKAQWDTISHPIEWL